MIYREMYLLRSASRTIVSLLQVQLLIGLWTVSVAEVVKLEVQSADESSSAAAASQLQKIEKQAQRMKYGGCWIEALKILDSGCRQLTDETQGRIAYAFMRCHLKASGRNVRECPAEKPISECASEENLKDLEFSTYTEFFTHSQQICFHLQNQAWHEVTENTIDRLAGNSEEVATRLEHSSTIAHEIATRQNISLKNQDLLLKREEQLKLSMEQSVLDVQRSHAETKQIISEQRALFSEVFDRVAVLQKTVLGEFSSIYTFGFYVGSTVLAYILTSTSRTSGARIWLFLVLILNAVTERIIAKYHISDIDGSSGFSASTLGTLIPDLIHERIWICRQVYCCFALVTLIVSVLRFKDYNKINNTLLNEIKHQNEELQKFIKENIPDSTLAVESSKSSALVVKAESIHDEVIGKRILLEKMHRSTEHLGVSQDETIVDYDATLTPTRTIVDLTDDESDNSFQCSDIIEGSESSSMISVSSTSSHSTVRRNGSIRSSTPVGHSLSAHDDSTDSSQVNTSLRKMKRRTSVMTALDESIAYVEPPAESVFIGGYNLRRRRSGGVGSNIVVQSETVEEFTSYVLNGLARQSAARRKKIQDHIADSQK